ncbi:hypothetical protein V6B08_15360 [Ferrovibrio sp. MS7]|uniref:hypothetical protein n=1 Tax=Ferrovibrio plantarum TaxID=3119164 RepID=UPI003135C056
MRGPNRSPRIAALCVLGKRAHRVAINKPRARLLLAAAQAIAEDPEWHGLDALLLPGAFFRASAYLGGKKHPARVKLLAKEGFMPAVREAVAILAEASPGSLVVFGVDSASPRRWEFGDQLCIAVGADGITGLARKIIPADQDTIHCKRVYVPALVDYASPHRFVILPSGHKAALCSCFDMFGICGDPGMLKQRGSPIRDLWLPNGKCPRVEEPGFKPLREQALREWQALLDEHHPTLALAAIHAFKQPGRDGYWQRHGLAVASAALRGGLAIGAAHFEAKLPSAKQSTLAAMNVPASVVAEGPKRGPHRAMPLAAKTIQAGSQAALLRLYGAE